MKRDFKMKDIKCGMLPAEGLHTRDYNSKQASTSIIHCINCEHERTLSGRHQKIMLVYPRSNISCHSLWRRTFNELQKLSRLTCNLHHFITTRFLNYILYFITVLSRLLSSWKFSYKGTYLQCLLLVYGVLLFSTHSLGEEVTFMSQRQGKLLDSFIPVGMGFVYKIPNRTFDCEIERIEASEGSSRTLPWWLAFDETKQTFYGVPSMKDIGSYEILVVAVARSESETGKICGMRAFTIYVSLEDKNHFNFEGPVLKSISVGLESSETQPSKISNHFVCIPGLQAVLATVVISADIHKLNGHQRMTVLEGMAQHMNFSSSKIALFANADGHPLISQLEDPSIVNSGSGDGRYKKGPKSILTWKVSCGAMRLGTAYLSELETNAQDGTISNVLGYPVVGWHVTSGVQKAKHRARRAIAGASTPTPTTTAILPTQAKNISTVMITDSISLRTAFVSPNSTLMPTLTFPSTLQITPTSTVLMSSTLPVEATVNFTSSFPVMSTTLDTVQTSTPALSSVNLTTVLESITPSPAANISVQINSTAIAETENSTGIVLSTQFQNTSAVASSGTAARVSSVYVVNSTSVLNSTRVSSTSMVNSTPVMNSTRVSSTSMVNSTPVMNSTRVSSTSMVNSTSVLNSTRVSSTSLVSSTSVMNSTRVSSTYMVNSTSVLNSTRVSSTSMVNSTSLLNSTRVSSTSLVSSTSVMNSTRVSSTYMVNSTSVLNSTRVSSTSMVNSTSLLNSTRVSSTSMVNSSSVLNSTRVSSTSVVNSTSVLQLDNSTTVFLFNSSIMTRTISLVTPSPTVFLPENSSAIVNSTMSSMLPPGTNSSTVSITLNQTEMFTSTVASSALVNSSVVTSVVPFSVTTAMPSSVAVNSTSFLNQTSSIQPSFQTSSLHPPVSTTTSSLAMNVTSNSTSMPSASLVMSNTSVVVSSSTSNATDGVVLTSVVNSSAVVSVVTPLSTVLITSVNLSSTRLLPTVMNSSLVDATSIASSLVGNTSVLSVILSTVSPNATSGLDASTNFSRVSLTSANASSFVYPTSSKDVVQTSVTNTTGFLTNSPTVILNTTVLQTTSVSRTLEVQNLSSTVVTSTNTTLFETETQTIRPTATYDRSSTLLTSTEIINVSSPSIELSRTVDLLNTTAAILPSFTTTNITLRTPSPSLGTLNTSITEHVMTSFATVSTLVLSATLNESSLMTESRSLVVNRSVTSTFFPLTNMTSLLLPSSMTSRISSSSMNSSVANFTEVFKTETVLTTATSVIVQNYSSSFKSTAITVNMTSSMLTATTVNMTSSMLIQNQTVSSQISPTLVTVNMTTKLTTHNETSSVQPSSTLISQNSTSVLTMQNQSGGIPTSVVPSSTLLPQRNMSSTSILLNDSSLMTESRSLVVNRSVTSTFFPLTNMTSLLLPSSMTSRISSRSSMNSSVANFTEVFKTETVLTTATSVIQNYSSSFKSIATTVNMTSSMLTATTVNMTSSMLIQNQTVSSQISPTLVTVNMTTKLTTHNETSSVQPSSTLISQNSTSVLTMQNQSGGIPTSVVPSSTLLPQRNTSSTSILMKNSSSPVTSLVTSLMTSLNATTSRAFSIAQSSSLELPYSSINASKDVNTSGAPTSSPVFSTSVVPSSTDNVTMSTVALNTSSSVVTSPSSVIMETQTPYPTVTPRNVSTVPLSSSLTPPLTTSLPVITTLSVSTVASSSSNYTSDVLNGTKTTSLDERLTTHVSSLVLTTAPVNSSSEIKMPSTATPKVQTSSALPNTSLSSSLVLTTVPVNNSSEFMLPSSATPTVLTASSLPNSSLSTTMIASSSIISTTVLGTTSEYLEFSTSVPSSNVTTLVAASTTLGSTSSLIVLEETTRVVTGNSSTPYASTTLMVSSVLPSSSPLVFTSSPNISSVTQTMTTALRTSLAKSSVLNSSAITSTTLPPRMFTSSFVSLSTSSYEDGTSVFTSAISTVLSPLSSSVVGNSTVIAPVTSQTSFSPSTSFILSSANISTVSPTSQTTSPIVPTTTPPDLPPRLRNDIGRLQATAGKVFRYVIPEDVFYDEDGNTRNLSLTLKRFNDELIVENITKDYWLMFDGSKQEIYGLPMEKDVPSDPERGIKFLLEARDRLRQIGYDAFEIMITKSNIPYTQSLSMRLLNDFTEFEQNISQRMDLVSRISRYYGDPDSNQVRVISYSEGSVLFTWTNDSLPSDVCNTTQINYVAEKVVGRDGVTLEFKEFLAPEYSVTSANRTLTGVCNTTIVPPPLIPDKVVGTESSDLWEKHVLPGIIVVIILIVIAILLLLIVLRRRRANPSDPEKRTYKKRKPIILEPEMEMKPRSGKPLILENDELSHPPSYMSEMSLDKTPHYDSDDYDEEDYKSTPTRSSPVYETPPPVYNVPREPFEQPPPAYRLPPTFYTYALPPWETSSDV